ncbi:MAG: MSMEG_0569 family flavin-dependent oxidoreductase [Solirubrobacteraceae bacterium]|nr:MSMEG_0569 family flavin-dependent oxidoreductase [Solirubrobacteraceae bacterium]
MPEVAFDVRWPDGKLQQCVSPSRSIEAVLAPGARYSVEEFVRRSGDALRLGSERVRQKYGFHCTAAAAEIQAIEQRAQRFSGDGAGDVVVVERVGRQAVSAARPRPVGGHHDVIVVGGGQAGLSASWYLQQAGLDHLVLERSRAFSAWKDERWDAFCLVTPNWQCQLPGGFGYDGDDPDGFMVRDEITDYLDRFRASFDPPVIEGVTVTRISRAGAPAAGIAAVEMSDDGTVSADSSAAGPFVVETTAGTATADQIVLAVGGYHVPAVPRIAEGLPSWVTQVHSQQYRNADVLPDGAVLVVGSGQSGAQIAEDLHLSGRQVHLAVGDAPRVARFHRGRDVVAWLHDMGHYDLSIDEHPEGSAARKEANHYVTGRDGGRDIDLRKFASEGMGLHGRLLSVADGTIAFSDDLALRLDAADATYNRINAGIDRWIAANGVDTPPAEPYVAEWQPEPGPSSLDLVGDEIRTVIWATGFRPDWSWVDLPFLDATGYPAHDRGVIAAVPGLHVLGLPWLHTWGSGRFASIDRDARHLIGHVAAKSGVRGSSPQATA